MTEPEDAGIHASDFPYDFHWLNSGQPLSLHDDLAGHVVLLHFWTSCSINCHHVFVTLAFLEQRFADRPFVVVGVHSGKYEAEQDPEQVEAFVKQYGLRHPVVVDEDLHIYGSYVCRAWPTIVLIDASGRIRYQGGGEPDRERMVSAIDFLLDEAVDEALIHGEDLDSQFTLEEHYPARPLGGLSYPTKLAFDPLRKLLWIADTANHRIVAACPETGEVPHVVGCGLPGAGDGDYAEASFYEPRGLAVGTEAIFVADTNNHLLRRIDLASSTVQTVLGMGKPVLDYEGGRSGREQGLNSPWGICLYRGDLYVAMAGLHQLWRVELDTWTARAVVGYDQAGLQDGPAKGAALAQPSGLSAIGNRLAFVDSDASAVRVLELDKSEVRTLIGKGLFTYGDRDGPFRRALLQHPRDLVFHRRRLIVADTYNHRVKCLDLEAETVETILGAEEGLCRPEGLAVMGDTLYVADTGNHRLLKWDFEERRASVLKLEGLPESRTGFGRAYKVCKPLRLRERADVSLSFPLPLPKGARLHPEAPMTLQLENHDGHVLVVDMTVVPSEDDDRALVEAVSTAEGGEGSVRFRLAYMTCFELDEVCHVHELRGEIPITLADSGVDLALVAFP